MTLMLGIKTIVGEKTQEMCHLRITRDSHLQALDSREIG
jgi:hypothetical protein